MITESWTFANLPQMMAVVIKLFAQVTANWRLERSKFNKDISIIVNF